MPEVIPDHVPSPRTLLAWDGTAYRPVSIDAAGRLQVRGEDQLFSYCEQLASPRMAVVSAANGYVDSNTPPAGVGWVVTNVTAADNDTALTRLRMTFLTGGVGGLFHEELRAIAADEYISKHTLIVMENGDTIRCQFTGALAADECSVHLVGYKMTLEV